MQAREIMLTKKINALVIEYLDNYSDDNPEKAPAEIMASLVAQMGWVGVKCLPGQDSEEFIYRVAGALQKFINNFNERIKDFQ